MWKYAANIIRPGENDWSIIPKVYVGPPIRKINWGGGNKFLAINSVRQAFILTEQDLAVGYSNGVSAFQVSTYENGMTGSKIRCIRLKKQLNNWNLQKISFLLQEKLIRFFQVAPSTIIVKFHENEGTSTISTQIQIEKIQLTLSYLFLFGKFKKSSSNWSNLFWDNFLIRKVMERFWHMRFKRKSPTSWKLENSQQMKFSWHLMTTAFIQCKMRESTSGVFRVL